MSDINCPSCGNKEINTEDFFRRYVSPINNENYKAYRCKKCDLEFWSPRKLEKTLYEEDVFNGYESSHDNIAGATEKDGWFGPDKWFKKYVPLNSGKLLDVGCSNGSFLFGIIGLGLDVYGIDFDRKSIDAGKKRGLQNLFPMALDEFTEANISRGLKFDAITFFDVLEHQSDPSGFIKNVKSVLRQGGSIVGTVPNRDRMFVSLYRAGSLIDYPPHHFTWWNKASLRNFLERNGFGEVSFFHAEPRSLKYLVCGGFYKAVSTATLALLGSKRTGKKSGLAAFVMSVILFPLGVLSFILLRLRPEKIFFRAWAVS